MNQVDKIVVCAVFVSDNETVVNARTSHVYLLSYPIYSMTYLASLKNLIEAIV